MMSQSAWPLLNRSRQTLTIMHPIEGPFMLHSQITGACLEHVKITGMWVFLEGLQSAAILQADSLVLNKSPVFG